MPAALPPALPSGGAAVIVAVANTRNDHGTVRVSLCPRRQFLADACPYEGQARARAGVTVVTIEGVPPGEYGAQAFHDENNNGKVDRGLFGIPREGVGFSRDARIVLSPPKWRDAMFAHGAAPQDIRFSLRYFMGAKTPAEWAADHPAK